MKLRLPSLAALLFAGSLVYASDYEIRLSRPSVVGGRFHMVASGMDEQSMAKRIDGQAMPAEEERKAFELIADCETLAVSPKGSASKRKMVIEKLVRTAPGQPAELLPPGSVVIVENVGGKTTFSIGDRPVTPVVADALETAGVAVSDGNEANDDIIFGTKERKKVGDSWPINAAAAAANMAESGIRAQASNVTGASTLVEVIKANNQELLRISGSFTMQGVSPPVPPGMTIQKSEAKANFAGLFPSDITKPEQQIAMDMSMQVFATVTRNGKTVEMVMSKKASHEAKFTYD